MKKINIKIIITDYKKFINVAQIIAAFINTIDVFHIEINLVFVGIKANQIRKIIDFFGNHIALNDVTSNKIITYIITVEPKNININTLARLRGKLLKAELVYDGEPVETIERIYKESIKKNIPCMLVLKEEDFRSVMEVYNVFSKLGMPIIAKSDIIFDDLSIDDFMHWAYDKNGSRLSLFSDIATQILLNYKGTYCRFKSCLSKYFTIDDTGNIYSCINKDNYLCNISNIQNFRELYNCDNFIGVLKQAITTRNDCKDSCVYYDVCQGGCPLNSPDNIHSCKDRVLFELYGLITDKLKEIIEKEDYKNLNPALRSVILSSVASNKLFEGRF